MKRQHAQSFCFVLSETHVSSFWHDASNQILVASDRKRRWTPAPTTNRSVDSSFRTHEPKHKHVLTQDERGDEIQLHLVSLKDVSASDCSWGMWPDDPTPPKHVNHASGVKPSGGEPGMRFCLWDKMVAGVGVGAPQRGREMNLSGRDRWLKEKCSEMGRKNKSCWHKMETMA